MSPCRKFGRKSSPYSEVSNPAARWHLPRRGRDAVSVRSGCFRSVVFGQCVAAPCFGESARRVRPVVPDFGAELFAGGKRQEAMEIIGFRSPHAMKWCQYCHHAGAQVTSIEPIAPSVHVEPFFRQLAYQRTGFPFLRRCSMCRMAFRRAMTRRIWLRGTSTA